MCIFISAWHLLQCMSLSSGVLPSLHTAASSSVTIVSNTPQPPTGGGQMPESGAVIGVVVTVVIVLLIVLVTVVAVVIAWRLRNREGHSLPKPFHKRRGKCIICMYIYLCIINRAYIMLIPFPILMYMPLLYYIYTCLAYIHALCLCIMAFSKTDKAKNEATVQSSNGVGLAPQHELVSLPQYEVVINHTTMAEYDTANYAANMSMNERVGPGGTNNQVYQYVPSNVSDCKECMHCKYVHLCSEAYNVLGLLLACYLYSSEITTGNNGIG